MTSLALMAASMISTYLGKSASVDSGTLSTTLPHTVYQQLRQNKDTVMLKHVLLHIPLEGCVERENILFFFIRTFVFGLPVARQQYQTCQVRAQTVVGDVTVHTSKASISVVVNTGNNFLQYSYLQHTITGSVGVDKTRNHTHIRILKLFRRFLIVSRTVITFTSPRVTQHTYNMREFLKGLYSVLCHHTMKTLPSAYSHSSKLTSSPGRLSGWTRRPTTR